MNTWTKSRVICAAGVYGAAWTKSNELIITSPDGYSICSLESSGYDIIKLRIHLPKDSGYIDLNNYKLDTKSDPIEMFSHTHKVGKVKTMDGWELSILKTPNGEQVLLSHVSKKGSNHSINLERLENFDLSFSFSDDDKYFAIVGSGGAEVYERK